MTHHYMRKNDEGKIGVLFIAGPITDHSHVIRNALEKAQSEGQIGVVEYLEGCCKACEDRIERVLERHRIDVIVAPDSAYRGIERMRLAHLFVDLEALMFAGEAVPERFSARPGQFGIAGTTRIDAGLPSSSVDWVQNSASGSMVGGMGRPGAIGMTLGMGGSHVDFRDLLGAGEGLPKFHLGANVAGGTETVRFGDKEYSVSLATNDYGGKDYYPLGESGIIRDVEIKTDGNGNVRESTTVTDWEERDLTIVVTKKYDKDGRETEYKRITYYEGDKKKEKEEKPSGMEPDDTGKDVRTAVRKFVEHLMLKQLWEAMLSRKMPPDPTDVTREFLGWVMQQSLTDFCHFFEAEIKEKDETGYAWAYWVTQAAGTRYVRASKLWEYLWRTGAPIDPVGEVAYGSRVAIVGGIVDQQTGELALSFNLLHSTH